MISFSELGNLGRLGNQLFQYSYLRSQANRMGVSYACPHWIGDDLFNLNESNRIISDITCKKEYREPESNCGFNKSAIEIEDDTDVWGFYQSPNYFCDEVKSWLTFSNKIVDPSLKKYVGIHLRFGDYVSLEHVYTKLAVSYYKNAISNFFGKNFLVFSDDIQCAKILLADIKSEHLEYFTGETDLDDFIGLMGCHGHIICNSSFSWWAAYLSPNNNFDHINSLVVYPRQWFNPKWKTQNNDIGIYNWKSISHETNIQN